MEDPAPSWAARVVAANLTTAAHVYMLSAQLRGETVSLAEAISSVRATWDGLAAEIDGGGAVWHSTASTVVDMYIPSSSETVLDMYMPSSPETVLVSGPDTERVVGATASTDDGPSTEKIERKGPTAPVTLRGTRASSVELLDGRYALLERLGEGGMGEVYLAEQVATKRLVAIKFLGYRRSGAERAERHFRQEASALARLNHPSIAQVYDVSRCDRGLYIAMEYVPGETVRSALARSGPPPIGEGLRLLREIALAVGAAHEAGIIHRDLKPENVMLVFDGSGPSRPKVLDFGLAVVDEREGDDNATAEGIYAGTPAYMAPEQASTSRASPASDVYSLGVMAYELLTGVNPFADATAADTAKRHATLEPQPPAEVRPDVPAAANAAILRALAKQPEERFATATDFARAL